ncbi:MAG: DNA-methyltransferase [Thermoplasmatota archaeon]
MDGPAVFIQQNEADLVAALDACARTARIFPHSSESMAELAAGSVHLVVTSPPYPMIEMWDAQFAAQAPSSAAGGPSRGGQSAGTSFDAAHALLARVWRECYRVLAPGGILCVNIGDATRTIDGEFRCFPNHARVLASCEDAGFTPLVPILWKKPTNKPNAFLGSGFLPPNAYVTLDCEYILIFRKGRLRAFKAKDPLRYASQISKAERDVWFSQVWDVLGARQDAPGTAPFPAEVPERLIRMFSCLGDTVLDPFAGTGVTLEVARALGRTGIGYEIQPTLAQAIATRLGGKPPAGSTVLRHLLERYPTNSTAQNGGPALTQARLTDGPTASSRAPRRGTGALAGGPSPR